MHTADEVAERLEPWRCDMEMAALEIRSSEPMPPPVAPPARNRPIPIQLRNTETNFLIEPMLESGSIDSPSQTSVGTTPTVAIDQETIHMLEPEPRLLPRRSDFGSLPSWLRWMMIIAGVGAVLAIAAVILTASLPR